MKISKNPFYIVILTIILVLSVELIMSRLYSTTGSTYLSNANDVRSKFSCSNNFKDGSKKPVRAAIFGGSASVGHATPISFFEYLCDSGFNNNNDLEITNYSRPSAPFSGFQSEIIKSVMDHYDVIIIYSGDAEFWAQIYRRDALTIFQNGISSAEPKLAHREHINDLNNIKARLKSRHVINYLKITDYSRIYYFTKRAINGLAYYLQGWSNSFKGETKYPKNFYYKDYFLTQNEQKNMVTLFKKDLTEISHKLRNDQKLIVSTVMSNDLFPPIADVYPTNHNEEIDILNKELRQLYLLLSNNEYDEIQKSVGMLPESAQRYYLEGLLCLKTNTNSKNYLPKNCLSILKKARELDGLVFRILPEINTFIRQFQQDNVIIVDPVEDMMKKVGNIDDYRKYFIDFQHPSILGHALIAENILFGLFPSTATSRSYNVSTCGVEWKDNGESKELYANTQKCMQAYSDNIRWIKFFLEVQPTSYQYDYFTSRSERDLMTLD